MRGRPHQNKRIDYLENLAEQGWSSLQVLEEIAHELSFRSTARAARLDHKIRIRMLELEKGRQSQSNVPPSPSPLELLFAKVGLHPSAPSFVIEAARKAFRKHYHPDTFPDQSPAAKKAAEEAFKVIDNYFEEIFKTRE